MIISRRANGGDRTRLIDLQITASHRLTGGGRTQFYMRKTILTLIGILCVGAAGFAAGASPSAEPDKKAGAAEQPSVPLAQTPAPKDPFADTGRRSFVVETDEQSASESLDRISGKFDLGFAMPYQTYESEHQQGSGPFGAAKEDLKSAKE